MESNDASEGFRYAFEYANDNPNGMVNPSAIQNLAHELDNNNKVYADTHEIHHGLDDEDMRILHKILARAYPSDTGVGRKRCCDIEVYKTLQRNTTQTSSSNWSTTSQISKTQWLNQN